MDIKTTIIPEHFVSDNLQFLDDKKPQTSYKIKYITKYVEEWLYVSANTLEVKNINFVDCMCNAGVYADGEPGTAAEVLKLFNFFALKHPEKHFNLLLNDIDLNRLKIMQTVLEKYIGVKSQNIKIIYENEEVNSYLCNSAYFRRYFNCYPSRSANLIFVDPYNFTTVSITALEKFIKNNYCELLFNIFTNDFVRNQSAPKIKQYLSDESIQSTKKEDLISEIRNRLKVGHMSYCFSYEFKITTNAELYQIMYLTPNIKGLEKLKIALWGTFNGKEFYRNEKITGQISIFSEEDEKNWMINYHSNIAKNSILEHFNGQVEFSYNDIELYIMENTMLNANQIIEYVLKPLILEGKIKKLGRVKTASNYKKDQYSIGVSNDS